MNKILKKLALIRILGLVALRIAMADDVDDISKQLSNPVLSLKNLHLRYDYDKDTGDYCGSGSTLRVQPIFSFKLNED